MEVRSHGKSCPVYHGVLIEGYTVLQRVLVRCNCHCLRALLFCLMAGQMIRIWGHVPFQSSSTNAPPPIRPNEPFWKQFFQRQISQKQQEVVNVKQQVPKQDGMSNLLTTKPSLVAATKVQSPATPPLVNVRPGLGAETAPTTGAIRERAAATVAGAEPISIWGTGPSIDSGMYMYLEFGIAILCLDSSSGYPDYLGLPSIYIQDGHLLNKRNGPISLGKVYGTLLRHAPLPPPFPPPLLLPLATEWYTRNSNRSQE